MLWGRVTYEMMESHWPAVPRDDVEAPPWIGPRMMNLVPHTGIAAILRWSPTEYTLEPPDQQDALTLVRVDGGLTFDLPAVSLAHR